jgi:cupin 2 domain-containing protein
MVSAHGNLFGNIPAHLPGELCEAILSAASFRVERIVSRGHASPEGFWYDQAEHEWVLLVSGAARVRFEGDGQAVEMKPGDYLHIPARRRHRVEWTAPGVDTVWLAIHYA